MGLSHRKAASQEREPEINLQAGSAPSDLADPEKLRS